MEQVTRELPIGCTNMTTNRFSMPSYNEGKGHECAPPLPILAKRATLLNDVSGYITSLVRVDVAAQ